jgi:hypothetical protein
VLSVAVASDLITFQRWTARTLGPILEAQLDGASYVYTDEGGAMKKAAGQFERHESISHSIGD